MTYWNHRFHDGTFDGFESSDAILEAIEDVAGHEFDASRGSEECPARRVWASPTPDENAAVIARAWELETDPEVTELYWGASTVYRPATSEDCATPPATA